MTAEETARKFALAAKRLPQALEAAERQSLAELKAAAVARSQGPHQEQDLRRMGHPYSRRNGPRLPPNVINRWSGQFQAAWVTEGPQMQGGDLVSTLSNTSDKAAGLERGLVFGKPVMVERQPHLGAFEDIRADREDRLKSVWTVIFR